MLNTVLFDDERSFKPGFRDEAIVLRDKETAEIFFEEMTESGFIIDELWLDFNLKFGSTTDVLRKLPGKQVRRVLLHSSAWEAKNLVETFLRMAGYEGVVEVPIDNVFSDLS